MSGIREGYKLTLTDNFDESTVTLYTEQTGVTIVEALVRAMVALTFSPCTVKQCLKTVLEDMEDAE